MRRIQNMWKSYARATRVFNTTWRAETLEARTFFTAVLAPADPIIYGDSVSGTMSPQPGHTLYVAGFNSQGTRISEWANASAITPNIANDLVLNVTPSTTDYVATNAGAGGTIGTNLLTNGLTQTQVLAAPSANQAALGDGTASDPSNNANSISELAHNTYFFDYNLGTAGGAVANAGGYDLSEIDLITGHHDVRSSIFSIDVLVEPVGSSQFLSLSGGKGFSLTRVPKAAGGTTTFDNGSVQMAIVNDTPGQPFTQHIQAVRLLVLDASSFFREFVVTGTPSAPVGSAPSVPGGVAASFSAGSATVSWNAASGAAGYTITRATGSGGQFAPIGSVVGSTSFVDASVQPGSTYYYKVSASGNGDSSASAASTALVPPNFGATAYLFHSQLWQGSPNITENLPKISYSGYDFSSEFPVAPAFDANAFSAFIQGNVTTDLAGQYTFVAPTDDDGYLYVNGQLVSSDPGLNVNGRSPAATFPITLAADTAYDFVFLENNRVGQWSFSMNWHEPTAGGTAGPSTLVPATQFTSNVDPPPTPAQPTVQAQSDNSVQVNWSTTGDASSFAYIVQRAPAGSNGNAAGSFVTVGQVFSGPTTAGAAGAPAWGASSFTDVSTVVGTAYVYRVGAILIGKSLPDGFSNASNSVAPGTVLSPTISGRLPTQIVAGQKAGIAQTLTVTNSGHVTIPGMFTGKLFLSTTPNIDSNSIQISSTSKTVKLKPRGRLSFRFNVSTIPSSVAGGTYYLISRVVDPGGNAAEAASTTVMSIQQPRIDLAGTFTNAPVPGQNGQTKLTFTVTNFGNIPAVGSLAFNVDRSPDGLLADAIVLTTSSTPVNLKPGKPHKFTVLVTLPSGTYFVLIHLDPLDVFNDANPGDNTITSPNAITVT